MKQLAILLFFCVCLNAFSASLNVFENDKIHGFDTKDVDSISWRSGDLKLFLKENLTFEITRKNVDSLTFEKLPTLHAQPLADDEFTIKFFVEMDGDKNLAGNYIWDDGSGWEFDQGNDFEIWYDDLDADYLASCTLPWRGKNLTLYKPFHINGKRYETATITALEDAPYTMMFSVSPQADGEVVWTFSDNFYKTFSSAEKFFTHVFPAQEADYQAFCSYTAGGKFYRGELDFSIKKPQVASTYRVVDGTDSLVIDAAVSGAATVFVKIRGISTSNDLNFNKKKQTDGTYAFPKDLHIDYGNGVFTNLNADLLAQSLRLKTRNRWGELEDYDPKSGFIFNDGKNFELPFYFGIPALGDGKTGVTLPRFVIWDTDSKGIFGSGDFDHQAFVDIKNFYLPSLEECEKILNQAGSDTVEREFLGNTVRIVRGGFAPTKPASARTVTITFYNAGNRWGYEVVW